MPRSAQRKHAMRPPRRISRHGDVPGILPPAALAVAQQTSRCGGAIAISSPAVEVDAERLIAICGSSSSTGRRRHHRPHHYPPKNCDDAAFPPPGFVGRLHRPVLLRRNEQTGDLYYASWGISPRCGRRRWNLLVDEISADVDGYLARHPRTAVSFHKQTAVQFSPENVNRTREMAGAVAARRRPLPHLGGHCAAAPSVRGARLRFVLATMLRRPTPTCAVSDYLHEGAPSGKSLADWMSRDVQAATAARRGRTAGTRSRR